MSWPLSQDYNEAIQSPASNFADPDLKRGEAATNALGMPHAVLRQLRRRLPGELPRRHRWAVKCFTREVPGLRKRYQEISKHLRQAKLPFTVDFNYLEQGIRVRGNWYPVLKMHWVEGLTLNEFVGKYVDKPAMLEALLQVWGRMAKYLRTAIGPLRPAARQRPAGAGRQRQLAGLKLIDYDGMWVPALAGKKSGEVGHPSTSTRSGCARGPTTSKWIAFRCC